MEVNSKTPVDCGGVRISPVKWKQDMVGWVSSICDFYSVCSSLGIRKGFSVRFVPVKLMFGLRYTSTGAAGPNQYSDYDMEAIVTNML